MAMVRSFDDDDEPDTTLRLESYADLFRGNAVFEHAVAVTGINLQMARILLTGALQVCGRKPTTLTTGQLVACLPEVRLRFAKVLPDVLADNAVSRILREVIAPRGL